MNKMRSAEELSEYKRQLQKDLESHRNEMDSHVQTLSNSVHRIMGPFQKVGSGIGLLTSNRFLQIGLVTGLGYLLFSKRPRGVRKVGGFLAPLIFSRIRGFLISQAMTWALKRFN